MQPEFPGTTKESELPAALLSYLRKIEDYIQVPVRLISTGQRRHEMVVRGEI
jgi:adenylosuccinate synthase